MYIMLSIEATVYADSNDKYSSIFKISKTKKKKAGIIIKNLNIVLNIYRCLEFGTRAWSTSTYHSVKVSCPVTDSVCREVNVFPTLESLHRKKRERLSGRN